MNRGGEGAISGWVEELRELCQDGGAEGVISRWVEELRELYQDGWRS